VNQNQDLALRLGTDLLIGLTAGVGANFYLDRGPFHLYLFVIMIYPILLALVLLTRQLTDWLDERTNDEGEDHTRPQYAS